MAKVTTDPRFQRKQTPASPIRFASSGRAGGRAAASRKAHAEGAKRNQYRHSVVAEKGRLARVEK